MDVEREEDGCNLDDDNDGAWRCVMHVEVKWETVSKNCSTTRCLYYEMRTDARGEGRYRLLCAARVYEYLCRKRKETDTGDKIKL